MKKVKTKLLIMMFSIIIVTFLIFGGAYFYLSSNFIKRQAGNTFVNMANVVATEVNTEITTDYLEFTKGTDNLVTAMNGAISDESINLINNPKDYYEFHYITNYEICYIVGNDYIINKTHYSVDTENNKQVNYLNEIAIYKFSNLLVDNEDSTSYIFFRYKDVVVYFDASDFLTPLLKNVNDMPTNKYFVMENNANILLYEGSSITNRKIYNVLTQDANFSYKMQNVTNDLLEKRSGYGMFDIDDVSSFLIYSPVFGDVLENPLYIGYMLKYTDAVENSEYKASINYLRYSLIVIFASILIILSVTLYIAARRYTKREQDFSLSKINQYYIKPYAISVNKRGDILNTNKTYRNDVESHVEYHNVNDFKIYEMEEVDVLGYVKGQKSFVIEVEKEDKTYEYIRFLSIKTGRKYTLVGDNCTKEISEIAKNKKVAMFNAVTSLPNKLVFDSDVNAMCASGQLYVTNNSVVSLDILDFAKINRLFGFAAADNMVKQTSNRLAELLKDFNATIYNIRTSLFVAVIRDIDNYNTMISWIKTRTG